MTKNLNRYTVKIEIYNETNFDNPEISYEKVLAETGEEGLKLLLNYMADRIEEDRDLEVKTKTVYDNSFACADFYPDEDSYTLSMNLHVMKCEEGIEVGYWYDPVRDAENYD